MDLTKLSNADLVALKGGDLSGVSTEGLMLLKGGSAPAPMGGIPGNTPAKPETEPSAGLAGVPGAILNVASSVPAQLIGRGAAAVRGLMPDLYGTQEGAHKAQQFGSDIAQKLTYQPSPAGQAVANKIGNVMEKSKLEGIGPMAPIAGEAAPVGATIGKVSPKVAAAQKAGFRLTPEEAGAGIIAKGAAGLSGEPRLARSISNKNVELATKKVSEQLGIPEGTPLSLDTLEQVRKNAGNVYEEMRHIGRIKVNEKYGQALDKVDELYNNAAKDFPNATPKDVTKLVNNLRVDSFDGSAAVDMMKIQRDLADKAFRQGDTGVGKAHRAVMDAIEQQIEDHLAKTSAYQPPQLLERFKDARAKIAQSYQAQKALVGEKINPQTYARAVEKRRPLTGAALEVGETARQFPRSMMRPSTMGTGPTAHDVGLGVLGGGYHLLAHGLTGGAALPAAAALAARPATRAALASRPYQAIQNAPINLQGTIPNPETLMALGVSPAIPEQNR